MMNSSSPLPSRGEKRGHSDAFPSPAREGATADGPAHANTTTARNKTPRLGAAAEKEVVAVIVLSDSESESEDVGGEVRALARQREPEVITIPSDSEDDDKTTHSSDGDMVSQQYRPRGRKSHNYRPGSGMCCGTDCGNLGHCKRVPLCRTDG
jgi:hypothetical protein